MFLSGITLKGLKGFCSYKFYKTLLVFCATVVIEVIISLALGKSTL